MKFYELIKILNRDQDVIIIRFPEDGYTIIKYRDIKDIPITLANYEVIEIYGYDAEGYDGIDISIVRR